MKPLISIVIPAYNEEKLIEKTIISVQQQPYKQKEIIVIANGCTDRTVSISRKRADKVYERKRGLANAKNYGAKKSKGEILIFLDADTRMEMGLLEEIAKLVSEGYDCGKTKLLFLDDKSFKYTLIIVWENFLSLVGSFSHRISDGQGVCIFITKKHYNKLLEKSKEPWNTRISQLLDVDFIKKAKKDGNFKLLTKKGVYASVRRWEKHGYVKALSESVFRKHRDWRSYK